MKCIIYDILNLYTINKIMYNYDIIKKQEDIKMINVKDISEVIAKINFNGCGSVTCIHNIDNKCILKQCDMFEVQLRQED